MIRARHTHLGPIIGYDGQTRFKNMILPTIPKTKLDLYVITVIGDRLDLLAKSYYNDVNLWWVISSANPDIIRKDSYALKPGMEIRIPNNIQGIIEAFEELNK